MSSPARPTARTRPAVDRDAPAVAEIWYRGWCDGHVGHVPAALVAARSEESFRRRAADRVSGTVVADVDGEVAGFVMVVDDEVEQVYLADRHRGTGVAGLLLAAAERQVAANGHVRAWLVVVPGNVRARRFYEREGWADDGAFEHRVLHEDRPIPMQAHRYVKRLATAPDP